MISGMDLSHRPNATDNRVIQCLLSFMENKMQVSLKRTSEDGRVHIHLHGSENEIQKLAYT